MALSVTGALLLATALVVLIVAVTGQRDASRTAFRSQEALTAGSQLEKSLITIENGLRGYVASGRERFLAPATQALDSYPGELRQLTSLLSDDPGQQRRARRIGGMIADYVILWARPLIALARDRPPAARSVVITNGGRERLDSIRAGFARLFARERAVARAREERAEQRSSLAIAFGVGGLGLVFVVAVGVALYLRRAVVRPVVTVAQAAGRLADGELSARVPAEREDEIGTLARGFNAMADSLERGQAELRRSHAELERSNSELEQFASVTSHDLQAPLSTISMYAELLERRHGTDLDGGTSLIDGIRGATQEARTLIRDLLEYSRAGRGRLRAEAVAVETVVRTALEATAADIEEAGARVTVGSLPVVRAERTNLCRVFQNLVGNAVKFTDDRAPEVAIGAEREGPVWRFWVRDNGIGMDPEHTERIFKPFQRLHGEEDYAGTGIGLAVCARIIEQHGGRIWVTTAPGEGSVFSFTLPAEEA
ncbi:MAG: CHASE3 domain-containing protein [Actinomycetota bacterium]|nr:CHASE3 domain-containing protein [Actinomycetota bacterium]